MRIPFVLAAALIASIGAGGGGAAQTYPQRTVKFILPFGPASGTDITARLVSERLSARWGKPVVIENRPGGDGLVAINAFISANDDHTLLWVPVGTFAVHPFDKEKLPYDADRDLIPVANVSTLFLALSAPTSLGVNTFREFFELVRANPGKYNAAAANGNADFLMSGFLKNNNLDMAKVPYRDIMQGPNDLSENRIQLLSSSLAIVTPLYQAGRIKILAVTGRQRAGSVPDVPTVREAGYPALEMESIGGIFGPRGMPLATREQIAADVRAAVASDPSIATKLQSTGQVVDVRGPMEFAAGIKELQTQLAGIAKVLGLKAAQ
ncbi:MAG: tripartite tricarboxylate transporter substrate binding protein [Alphaproteobacteria bacterium]|nr:tripartite tricarboxylate transporter substrate binding protein [Alphaproteobacteria bacterium]